MHIIKRRPQRTDNFLIRESCHLQSRQGHQQRKGSAEIEGRDKSSLREPVPMTYAVGDQLPERKSKPKTFPAIPTT
ncbi:hypothetical protein TNCT_602481 [Trichonephila clavata]|uniref:Uncharacterized protein n=1 Tax=Trichonephila clavata TaxID=2740835 RepID=A0A8X6FNK3_TRICU|nr:hypothetical protein TNCT_602481 [Trichonephila clavata]